MVAPILAALGGQAMGATVGLGMSFISAALDGAKQHVRQASMFNFQPGIPEVGDLIDLINRNQIHEFNASKYLGYHGITWWPNAPLFPGVRYTDEQRQKRDIFDTLIKSKRTQIPIPFALGMYRSGYISPATLRELLTKVGAFEDQWMEVARSTFEPLDVGVLQVARNRGIISAGDYNTMLRRNGYGYPDVRKIIDSLREAIPPITDLIRFAIRDVWDPTVVKNRRLFDDLPPQLASIAAKQGLFGNSGIPIPGFGGGRNAKWSEVYWASHWQEVAAGQSFQMFHRLRPDRIARYRAQGFDVQTFGIDDLRRNLKIADYAPGDRDYLAAIAYAPMRLIDIRALYTQHYRWRTDDLFAERLGIAGGNRVAPYDRDWAIGQLRDRGLHPDDAAASVDLVETNIQTQDEAPIRNYRRSLVTKTISQVTSAYRIGLLGRTLALDRLVQVGLDRVTANQTLDLADLESARKIVDAAVRGIRSDYFNGTITEQEARSALTASGAGASGVDSYMALWTVQRNRTRRTATTQQLLKWLEEGLITQAEVIRRLGNLGWAQADQLTMLREVQLKLSQLRAKVMSSQQLQQRTRAKELAAASRQSQSDQKAIVSQLRQTMPRTDILRWLREGLVGRDWAIARLREQRYPEASIVLWIEEAAIAQSKTKAPAPLNPPPPPPPASTTVPAPPPPSVPPSSP